MTGKTFAWDPSEHLDSEETIVAYLAAALEEADPALVTAALGDIARAKGMTQIAHDAGLTRASLYKSLRSDANPEFGTIMRVVKALGVKLTAVSAKAAA